MKTHFWHKWKYVVKDGKADHRFCPVCNAFQAYCKLPKSMVKDGVDEGWLDVERPKE